MTTLTTTMDTHLPSNLDSYSKLDRSSMEALYRKGSIPEHFSVLDGTPKGRMLAVRGLDRGIPAWLVRGVSGSAWFPWEGKSFASQNASHGKGINRIALPLFHRDWFPFHTRIEPSHIDGQPCIYLDYDLPGNPWLIRKIRDELREVAPGCLIGPAMWKRGSQPAALVLWFGIQVN